MEDYYHSIFFEALDTIAQCISTRFDQPGYKTYCKLEAGECYDDDLAAVMHIYSKDLEQQLLRSQLLLLKSRFKKQQSSRFDGVAKFVKENQQLLSEVVKLLV